MIARRDKKCFLAATLVHGALMLVLLVGPGFLSSKPPTLPLLDYIPAVVVDAALNRGGNPGASARPAPPPPAPEPPKTEVTPPSPPQPKPQVKAPEPETPPEVPKPVLKADSIPLPEPKKTPPKKTASTTPTKPLPKVSMKAVTRTSDQMAKQREADRKAAEKATKDFQNTINQTTKSLSRSLSDSVSVEVTSGPGGGGPSVANWAQVVHSIYDRAWMEPSLAGDARGAKATIIIARDGSVISASLTAPSGNAALDQSVRTVLDRVREVPAFPAGAREERRTVTIKFNLLAQRLPG